MRIAYLTEWPPFAETGVLRKIVGQVSAWRQLGCTAEVFSISPHRDEKPALDFAEYGAIYGPIHQRNLERFPFARLGYANKIMSVPALRRAMRRFNPDLIYYRQNGPWYPGLGLSLSGVPVVMEINTDETAENRLWGTALSLLHKATQMRVLRRAAGFVCVTGEIAEKYAPLGKPVAVVPNSSWSNQVEPLAASNNSKPVFVFVGSPTIGAESWHGVDKIITLAARLTKYDFNVVGMTREDFPNGVIPANVIFRGYKHKRELEEIYRASDVGIGSLAHHRINLNEACPLKTREYLMFSLPVMIGYIEAEKRLNSAEYILGLGSHEDNVTRAVHLIEKFAWKWVNRRVDADLSFLSNKSKETDRLNFFFRVLSQRDPLDDLRLSKTKS